VGTLDRQMGADKWLALLFESFAKYRTPGNKLSDSFGAEHCI
jgi:hypothetical protein